ncbi:MAG: hypothetical protein LBJ72_08250, partial [Dysgonamonadaceae bacterium]|nr:hypothetical protein [Dysgonamonadaceae bacterium]
IWQPDNITSDTTPPDIFSKYHLPFYEKIGTKCREAGKVYLVHIDGKTKALHTLIEKAPIDVIESFTLPLMGSDMTIEEALQAWPDKVICPNFPSSLCLESKDMILGYMKRISASFGNKPYMIQISEDIDDTKYNHVLRTLGKAM